MIKYLKYMFMAAIIMIAATGCQEDIELRILFPRNRQLLNL